MKNPHTIQNEDDMRAALYIRVSTEEQAEEGYSLAAQERAGRAYALAHGWEVVRLFTDEGISGRSAKRPGLIALRAAVVSGDVQAVIVHKLDRLARNLRLLLDIIDEIGKQKAAFVSVAEQLDFSTPMGWAMFQVHGVFAELYSRNLSVETAKGKREKAQQGGWVGPLPIGYTKDKHGELIPSADAPVIQMIFEWYASGTESYTSIADELNAQGYQTNDWQTGKRGRFGRESIRTILGNYAYLGYVSAGGTRYKGRHTALVSEVLFDAIQQIRAERSNERFSPKRESDGWLIGAIYCERCGGKYWHQFGNRGAKGRYYACSGLSRRDCTAQRVRATDLEGQMHAILQQLVISDDMIPQIIAEMHRVHREAPPDRTLDTSALTARITQLKEALTNGILTKAEYEQKMRTTTRSHALEVAVPPNTQRALALVRQIPVLLEQALPSERLALVRALFDKVWIREKRIVKLMLRDEVGETLAEVARVSHGVPDGLRTLLLIHVPRIELIYAR
jgi:site-specific DNA recombinase